MNRLARCATSCVAIALLFTSAPFFTDGAGVVAEAQAPVDISVQPRVEDISSLVWQGSFRVPDDFFGSDGDCGGTSCATFAYGGTALAFHNESLFLVGHDQGQLATEVGIPALRKGPTSADLPVAGLLQLFADPTEGRMESVNPGSGTNKKLGGLFVHQDKLYSTVFDFYDGANTQQSSHFVSGTDLSILDDVVGPQRVKYCIGDTDCLNAGFFDGYFAQVPAEWQAALGGPVLNGNCCLNVINRTSWGPAAFTIDPAQLGVPGPGGELPDVTANALLYYFSDGSTPSDNTGNFHPLVEDVLRPADPPYFGGDDACHNTSTLFNCSSEVRGLVFPQGTRSVLFFGRQGLGNICYGAGTSNQALHGQLVDPVNEPDVNYCYDPADHNKGFHAWPYAHYVWAYDANDFRSVRDGAKNPWDLKPYKVFQLDLPLDTPYGVPTDAQNRKIGGAAYDPATGRIFLSQIFDDGRTPIIHVFKLDLGGVTPPPAPTPVASALTSPAPGATFAAREQLFSWNAGVLVTRYKIDVGSAPGGSDLFAGTLGTALQQLVTGLPSDGRAIHVRLSSEIGGVLQSTDYAFIAYTNHAPIVQPIDPQSGTVGTSFSFQVVASDDDGDALKYTAAGLPSPLAINETTGLIAGTPSAAGNFDIMVTVSDGELSAQRLLRLHVEDVTPPPPPANRLVNPGAQVNDEGDKVDFEIAADPAVRRSGRGRNGDRAEFTAVNLPDGLKFDEKKGRIHGHIDDDAAQASPYSVTITLREGSESWSITFDWTVRPSSDGNSGKGSGR